MIDDLRTEFSGIPVISLLERVVAALDPGLITGIASIRLMDHDPKRRRHNEPEARARYSSPRSSKRGAIELFFSRFASVPPELRSCPVYLTYCLTQSLGHELYHHRLHNRRLRKPKFSREQKEADVFGDELALRITSDLYPPSKNRKEWKRLRKHLGL